MPKVIERSLLTWRLTSLCISEEGPYDIFGKFRSTIGVAEDEFSKCVARNQFAQAFCCFWCASIWVGIAVAILYRENPFQGLIYSAAAICIQTFVRK